MAKPIVAIVGRPNVGKSTLFNKLTGQRLAIVEDTPGITRDRIFANCEWNGHEFLLVDTGGIEPKATEGILAHRREQAQIAIDTADCIIMVTDVRNGLTAADEDVAHMLRRSHKPIILAVNKCDKVGEAPMELYEFYNLGFDEVMPISSVHGHGTGDLLDECIRDAKAQGKKGLCILCAEGRKREFLADPKYLAYKGFTVADTSDCGITLMYLPLTPSAEKPTFKECAKHPQIGEDGFVLYYTDQCPFTYYWVPRVAEAAAEHGIPLKTIQITDRETAQNLPAPVTTYVLFRDGKFVTHAIQSDKKFLALAGVKG